MVLVANGDVIANGVVFGCLLGHVAEGHLPKALGLEQSSMVLDDGCH